MVSVTDDILRSIDDRAGMNTIRQRMYELNNPSQLETDVNSSSHRGRRAGVAGTTALYLLLAACGGGGCERPTSPTNPGNPGNPGDTGYATVSNYTVKTRPENGIVNATMTLQKNGVNVADVDITNNTINITADKKISPDTYFADIKSKDGSIQYRGTPIIIGNNSIKVPVDGSVNSPTRTNDLEIVVDGFDLQSYQSGTQFTEFGGGSRRWDCTNPPAQDLFIVLYEGTGSGFAKVDPSRVTREQQENITFNTQAIRNALAGSNRGPDGRQYTGVEMTTGGNCKPQIREGTDANLQDPNVKSGNRMVILPITNTLPGAIINPAVYTSDGAFGGQQTGQIYHALIMYNANSKIGSSAFRIDIGYAWGLHPPKQGIGSGLILIDLSPDGNYLPEVFTVSKLLNNRLYGHISNSQTPDLNKMR